MEAISVLWNMYMEGWTYGFSGNPGGWPIAFVYVCFHIPVLQFILVLLGDDSVKGRSSDAEAASKLEKDMHIISETMRWDNVRNGRGYTGRL